MAVVTGPGALSLRIDARVAGATSSQIGDRRQVHRLPYREQCVSGWRDRPVAT